MENVPPLARAVLVLMGFNISQFVSKCRLQIYFQ